ncbi:hypothetical protein [Nocardia arthritidis]|uniref:hypothetical protein n=1 Tax=Nocardia arthritidis TaxID=228602 RepID=UPI0007A4F210|nr:hypothetical protein [Nocardia arthritidis]
MRYNAIRAAFTVVAVNAALLGGQTLTTTPVAQAAGGICTFEFNKSPYVLHKAVVVGGTVKCDPAPLGFHLTLQLWHRSGTSNPKPKGEPGIVTQIPNPSVHVATMALDCVPGVWQGKIVIRATWDTGTDEGRKETAPTFIQC